MFLAIPILVREKDDTDKVYQDFLRIQVEEIAYFYDVYGEDSDNSYCRITTKLGDVFYSTDTSQKIEEIIDRGC